MQTSIAIDIGNSSIKVGLFINSQLKQDWRCQTFEEVHAILKDTNNTKTIISSVASEVDGLVEGLRPDEYIILSPRTPIPFKNHYTSKDTLGLDRIAALAGAEKINGGKNNLVIDIGSCITYDFLDKDNVYHGGSISPGIDIRFKAMKDYTRQLPLILDAEPADLIGKTTKESMNSGVVNGIAAELEGIIDRYKAKWPDLEVIMCGGGLNSFESKLKAHIFASPKLVLIGLNRILDYNEQS